MKPSAIQPVPPRATTTGSASRRRSRNSPMSNPRRASRPATRKRTASARSSPSPASYRPVPTGRTGSSAPCATSPHTRPGRLPKALLSVTSRPCGSPLARAHVHAAAGRSQLAPQGQAAKFSRSSGAGRDGESGVPPRLGARCVVMPGGATGQDPPRSAVPRPRLSPAMARDSRAGVVRSRRTPRRPRPSA